MSDSSSTLVDALVLLRNWMRTPREVATAVPSSPYLAKAMAATITNPNSGYFLELGGGTGAITKALVEAGVPQEKLLVVEANQEMAQVLRRRFPNVHLLEQDARLLNKTLPKMGVSRLAGVLSSLPMLNMNVQTQREILQAFAPWLEATGHFAQYTYGFKCPIKPEVLQELRWTARRKAVVLANLPPAFVWTFQHERTH